MFFKIYHHMWDKIKFDLITMVLLSIASSVIPVYTGIQPVPRLWIPVFQQE